MSKYHPSETITNNQATINIADLAYEAHGKCGCQTVLLSNGMIGGTTRWSAATPGGQPSLPDERDCADTSHVYRIVALSNTKFRLIVAQNIAQDQMDCLKFANSSFILKTGSEIFADFTNIEILSGDLMLYRDGSQS